MLQCFFLITITVNLVQNLHIYRVIIKITKEIKLSLDTSLIPIPISKQFPEKITNGSIEKFRFDFLKPLFLKPF